MGQSYQTLHPINEIPVSPVYERLPQLMARGIMMIYLLMPNSTSLVNTTSFTGLMTPGI
ncbi:LPS-assembly protein LptD [Legionella pneumophila]|uniref:LPS-assembly protein LptD n=1 Tax=Legionella pneumophila TaxID=446 RepID=UPI001F1B74A8|nr:LPS-assembly protein LptD [Legionella pneumophila]